MLLTSAVHKIKQTNINNQIMCAQNSNRIYCRYKINIILFKVIKIIYLLFI